MPVRNSNYSAQPVTYFPVALVTSAKPPVQAALLEYRQIQQSMVYGLRNNKTRRDLEQFMMRNLKQRRSVRPGRTGSLSDQNKTSTLFQPVRMVRSLVTGNRSFVYDAGDHVPKPSLRDNKRLTGSFLLQYLDLTMSPHTTVPSTWVSSRTTPR